MNPAIQAVLTIAIGVGGCIAYFWASNLLIDKVVFPARTFDQAYVKPRRLIGRIVVGIALFLVLAVLATRILAALTGTVPAVFAAPISALWQLVLWPIVEITSFLSDAFGVNAARFAVVFLIVLYCVGLGICAGFASYRREGMSAGENITRANMVRPWLFLLPAIIALGLYLAYPVFATLWLSFHDKSGEAYVGLANYQTMLGEPKFWESLRNNMLWLIVVPAMATAFGLLAAQLTDRISWGNIAKAMIFMPMAISFVGASVIWKLVYDVRPAGQDQIGILNAIYLALGGDAPQQWLQIPFWNNFFLMAVLIWIQAGFAMVILSAALRGIPEETVEAAIIDGASPMQVFFKIKVPQIKGTIVVVWTTITITVLKVFDIVLAMTNGEWNTQVLANYMFAKLFRSGTGDWGVGSAAAMVIMLLVTPILIWNVRNARKEMQ